MRYGKTRRNRTTRLLWPAVVLLLLLSVHPTFSQTMGPRLRVVAQQPVAESDLLSRAIQLRELLLIRLVNSLMFDVVYHEQLLGIIQREGMLPPEHLSSETVATLAARLEADYVLRTRLSVTQTEDLWTVELIDVSSNRSVFVEGTDVRAAPAARAAQDIADELIIAAAAVRMAQPADVRTLIDIGQFKRAARLLSWLEHSTVYRDDPVVPTLRAELRAAQAAAAFQRADRLAALHQFEQAIVEMNRAIAFEPENTEYRQFLQELQQKSSRAADESFERRVAVIRELLDQDAMSAALRFIDGVNRDYPERYQEIEEYRVHAQTAVAAQRAYRNALGAFWSREYDSARAFLHEAILLDPSRQEFGHLQESIDAADQRRQEADLVWQSYRNRWTAMNSEKLFLEPRRTSLGWSAFLGRGRYSFRDSESLALTEIPQWVVHGKVTRPYRLPVGFESPIISLGWYWDIGASLRFGAREELGPSGTVPRPFSRETIWSVAPSGGAGVSIDAFAFGLTIGLDFEPRVLFVHTIDRDPVADRDDRETRVAFAPALQFRTGVQWRPTQRDSFTLVTEWPAISTAVPTPIGGTERYQSRHVSLGYGRSLR